MSEKNGIASLVATLSLCAAGICAALAWVSWPAGAQMAATGQLDAGPPLRVVLASRVVSVDPACPIPLEPGQPFYILFKGPLSPANSSRLTALGLSFIGYAYPGTHFVRISSPGAVAGVTSQIRTSPDVLGTALREPIDALDAEAAELLASPGFAGGEFRIVPWRDISPRAVETLLADHDAEVLFASADEHGLTLATPFIDCRLSRDALATLAAHRFIEWIEPLRDLSVANVASRALSNAGDADVGINSPYNLTGDGLVAGVWDAGTGYDQHFDFQGASATSPINNGPKRVLRVGTEPAGSHATHVTGTIVGDGTYNAAARGYAPQAYAVTHNMSANMGAERLAARHTWRHVADNHSYRIMGSLGGYLASAQEADIDIRDVWLNMCKSAGNEGPGTNTVSGDSAMKNSLTIGAVSSGGGIAGLSSRGPTDDGRLIPHFTAVGVNVLSTDVGHVSYTNLSGTSMSSPSACGSVVLLADQWQQTMNGRQMAPDTTRGILAATAIDAFNQGPDYRYGFGIIDCKRAVELVIANGQSGGRNVVRGTVRQGDVIEYDLEVTSSSGPLKVVCSWVDIAASLASGVKLVNDIDLMLIAPDGTTVHHPWSGLLSGSGGDQTYQWTRSGPNRRDNIELAEVDSPTIGTWTIRVSGYHLPAFPQSQTPNTATGFVLVSETPITKAQVLFEDALNSGVPLAIPDAGPALVRTLTVSGLGNIHNARLYVDVRHPRRGDLEVSLRHPDGTTVVLESASASNRPDLICVYPDTRQLVGDLSSFIGKAANGVWVVTFTDTIAGNSGTLEWLALEIDHDPSTIPPNQPPVADAGGDLSVLTSAAAQLDGSLSYDPDFDAITYSWTQLGGTAVTLTGADTVAPTFTTPAVAGVLTFELLVFDANGGSSTDQVVVTVNLPPSPPGGGGSGDGGGGGCSTGADTTSLLLLLTCLITLKLAFSARAHGRTGARAHGRAVFLRRTR